MGALKFGKNERLTSKLVIEDLFAKGNEVKKFPFLLKYDAKKTEQKAVVKIVVSVPKRKAKLAVDRNRLRRQIKEAYRLNKKKLYDLCAEQNLNLALFLIYNGKEKEEYQLIENKLKVLLHELQVKLSCKE